MEGDEGKTVTTEQVPTIGGTDGAPSTAPVVFSDHNNESQFRAEGVMYPENSQVDVTSKPYPQGTAMTDTTPADDIN